MRSPAVALAWEFWWRHRLGLTGVAALVGGFAAYAAAGSMTAQLAAVSSVWFVMALCYVIGVFAYGFEARLETPESGFPARLFVLPVRTWVLVGWPMAQGVTTAVLMWLAWDRLVLRPGGVETPGWWPAMLTAVVAVSQAVVWFPFGLPWVRILVAVAVLSALLRAPAFLDIAGERFADPAAQDTVLTTVGAALVPVAFLVALAGVTRARRGDAPDWLAAWRALRSATSSWRERPAFRSAARAQVWYEWRMRGVGYVAMVGLIVAAFMALGVPLERDMVRRGDYGVVFLVTPMLVASFWGPFAGTSGESSRKLAGLAAFYATRPVSDSGLVVARFRAAALAAVAAWGLVAAATAAWMLWTGSYQDLPAVWDRVVARLGPTRAAVVAALLPPGAVLLVWRMMVVNLWAGLTGRAWIVTGQSLFGAFLVLQLMYEWVTWNTDPARRERILAALPWVAAAAVALKLLAGGWALRVLHRRGEMTTRTAAGLLAVWCAVAAALFALLLWLVPEGMVPAYGLALAAVLFVPLARLAVAPLALAWNRHR